MNHPTLCYLIIYLSEAIIVRLYADYIFDKKRNLLTNVITLFCLYAVAFFVSFTENFLLNTITFTICNIIYFYVIYNISYSQSIIHSIIVTVIMCISELFISGILSHFLPNFYTHATSTRNLLLLTVFSKTLFLICIYIASRYLLHVEKKRQPYNVMPILLILVPLSTIFTILVIVQLCSKNKSTVTDDIMVIICSILLLFMNLIVFTIQQYTQQRINDYLAIQLQLQREKANSEYYKMQSDLYETHNIVIHDIRNHLNTIATLNNQGNADDIQNYIQQLITSYQISEQAQVCNHLLLNSILLRYIQSCKEKNIRFFTDIRSESINFLSDNDITTIFCNILDNAIEACEHIPDAFIECNIFKREYTPLVIIVIMNSCLTIPKRSNNKILTHKSDKRLHGFGLKSVQRSIDHYNGQMIYYYEEQRRVFHTVITLRNPL